MRNAYKSGVSLIAVLSFMLAATTASVVIFRWLSQENFSSGSRLKGSEAYQASQAGLEAVKGWLANKGADAGALLKIFEENPNNKQPVRLVSEISSSKSLDLLAATGFFARSKKQNFEVYLTAAHTTSQPYKLKFLSIGTARDGSKHSQVGIFEVEGLYKVIGYKPAPPTDVPDIPTLQAGLDDNTQFRVESANIHGDTKVAGISTTGNLIVAGKLTTSDNAQSRIGCKSETDNTRVGDMYVLDDCNLRKFTVCGDAYVGGHTTAMGPTFRGDLYANGGITNNGGDGITVRGNLTLSGPYYLRNSNNIIDGNFVLDANTSNAEMHGSLIIQNDSRITASGNVWSDINLFDTTTAGNKNDANKYSNLTLGGSGKNLYIYINSTPSPNKRKAVRCGNTSANGCNTGNWENNWYQEAYPINRDTAHFRTLGSQQLPTTTKPTGAKLLENMKEQIRDCQSSSGKCVIDPLTVPKTTGGEPVWKVPAQKLNTLVNINNNTTGLPQACVRLVKSPASAQDCNFDSKWCLSCNSGDNFIKAANACYAGLKSNDPHKILYPPTEPDVNKKFLPITVKAEQNGRDGYFDGNFIFYFADDMNQQMKFPPTTDNSKVFVYFEKGATGNIPWTNSCVEGYCKRNYFIFSEKDIKGTSGSGKLNGAVFLADGAKIGGNMPDLTIERNQVLYDALIEMGIVTRPGSSQVDPGVDTRLFDYYHIPSTSHLKVKLESQYVNEEPFLVSTKKAWPSIMVLPRMIYLKPGEITNKNELINYFKVLYMNGAEKPSAKEDNFSCPDDVVTNGTTKENPCVLTSKTTSCNSSKPCTNTFHVVVAASSLAGCEGCGDGGDGGDGPPYNPDPDAVRLICAGITAGDVEEGTSVPAPTLTCSNGVPPSSTSWTSDGGPFTWWGTPNIPQGTFNNIKAKATCGGTSDLISNSCGSLTVTSNNPPTLTCNVAPNTIKAGEPASNAIELLCSDGSNPENRQYLNIGGSQSSLVAGSYNNVSAMATCGFVTGLTAACSGTLTVAELTCSKIDLYAKGGESIPTGDRPNLSCIPSSGNSPRNFVDQNNLDWELNNWKIPGDAYSGFQYKIKGKTTCSSLYLEADCGTVTVAGITCSGLPSVVSVGGTIPEPTLICNNSNSATVKKYIINNSALRDWSPTYVSTATANQYYDIKGKANCGTADYLKEIDFTCPTRVAVSDVSRCDYSTSLCEGIPFSEVIAESKNTTGWIDGPLCIFASSISQMGNNAAGQAIKVNGQVLPAKSGGANPEGRCGGTGQSWKEDNQLPCGNETTGALAGIPKMDNGYYIYIPPGGAGQNFIVTGGTLSNACSSTSFGCEYRQDWCGGKSYESVQHNSITKPTAIGTCLFISDFTFGAIQPGLNSTISINGVENACGSSWGECPYSPKPDKKDGGYYVYYEKGTINRWQTATDVANSGIVPGAVPTACDVSNTVRCNVDNIPSCNLDNFRASIPRPNVICPNNGTAGAAEFYIYNPNSNRDQIVENTASGGSGTSPAWNADPPINYRPGNPYESSRRVTLYSLYCDGTKKTFNPPLECGGINVKSSCDNSGITCSLPKTEYDKNELIIPTVIIPTVICPSGTAGNRTFDVYSPGSWVPHCNSSGEIDGGSYNSASTNCTNKRRITLTAVNCGGTTTSGLNLNCGEICTMSSSLPEQPQTCGVTAAPTVECSFSSDPVRVIVGQNISAPEIGCSNGSTPDKSGMDFTPSYGILPNNYANWKTSGTASYISDQVYFLYSPDSSSTIRVTGVKCGGVSGEKECGTIKVARCDHVIRAQAANCNNYIGTLPASPTPPANPYTACFKHTNDKCYVCKINNEGGSNTCCSNWVWNSSQVDGNLGQGYWYSEVNCPVQGITIASGVTLPAGTHTIANTVTCQGACTNGACTTTGIGGPCSAEPGYSCSGFQFTAGSTVTITGGSLRIDYCS